MSTRQEIENQMKELLGEGYCNTCKKLNFLKCYFCTVNYCSVACMILDDHEHAPGANHPLYGKFDAGNKSTVPHKTNKQKKIEETLTFKVMKDKLPEHVKMGVHVSVQGRLKKALEKMAVSDNKSKEGGTEEIKSDSSMSNKDTKKALEKTVEYEKQDETDNAKDLAGEMKSNSKILQECFGHSNNIANNEGTKKVASGSQDEQARKYVYKAKIDMKGKTGVVITKEMDDLSNKIKGQINAQSDEERRKIWKSFIEAREKELALLDSQLSALKLQN